MNIKTLVLGLVITFSGLSSSAALADGCCSGPSQHYQDNGLNGWLNQNWQGIVFGMVFLGPVQHWWNHLGSDYLNHLKRTYVDAKKVHKKAECCSCHNHA